jgi:hypothetical protein
VRARENAEEESNKLFIHFMLNCGESHSEVGMLSSLLGRCSQRFIGYCKGGERITDTTMLDSNHCKLNWRMPQLKSTLKFIGKVRRGEGVKSVGFN